MVTLTRNRRWVLGIGITVTILLVGGGIVLWLCLRSTDPCQVISNLSVVDLDGALNCYKTIKYDKSLGQQTIQQLRSSMQLSSTIDFLNTNTPVSNNTIDVDLDLKRIGDGNYNNSYEFQLTLSKYFKKLRDGHNEYSCSGFQAFDFQLPIAILPYYNEQQELILKLIDYQPHPDLTKEWEKRGIDLLNLINDTVIEIDHKPAMEYLLEYSNEFVGSSRDDHFRITSTLVHTLEFTPNLKIHPGEFTKLPLPPNQSNITINLKRNGKVVLPYLALHPNTFIDQSSFYDYYFKQQRTPSDSKYQDFTVNLPPSPSIPTIHEGEFTVIYQIQNAAVMRIYQFPDNETSLDQWNSEIPEALIALNHSKSSKIIFDLSNNPGGIIDSSLELLEYFFPLARTNKFPGFLSNKPVLNKVWQHYQSFDSVTKSNPDWDFMQAIEIYHNTSVKRIPYPTNVTGERILTSLMQPQPPIPLNKMAIITNSLCASSCALFTNWIQETYPKIPTYHLGHLLPHTSPSIGTLIGGNIISNEEFPLNITFTKSSQPFPYANIQFSISFGGFYSKSSPNQSLDFIKLPAQHSLNISYTDHFNPIPLWTTIIQKLSSFS